MPKFALETDIPVERSRQQIEVLLHRYGATAFGYASDAKRARIQFVVAGRAVQFDLPLPTGEEIEIRFDAGGRELKKEFREKRLAQAHRSRWRALLLTIQARLEAVDCGIETFEVAFLAHLLLPNGQTVKDHVLPALAMNKNPELALLGAP